MRKTRREGISVIGVICAIFISIVIALVADCVVLYCLAEFLNWLYQTLLTSQL
jgi:hypothetical protein